MQKNCIKKKKKNVIRKIIRASPTNMTVSESTENRKSVWWEKLDLDITERCNLVAQPTWDSLFFFKFISLRNLQSTDICTIS